MVMKRNELGRNCICSWACTLHSNNLVSAFQGATFTVRIYFRPVMSENNVCMFFATRVTSHINVAVEHYEHNPRSSCRLSVTAIHLKLRDLYMKHVAGGLNCAAL
jgi:hypothetical protein